VQLIEVSAIGVRAGIVRMTSPTAKLVWLMFPMIHLGERTYYQQVEKKMAECDLVLAEGVDSRIVTALTSSYRLAASPASGLVRQPSEPRATDHMTVQKSDISGAEFDSAWRKMPIGLRLGVPLLAPLYGLWLRYVANPDDWQSKLQTDDLASNDDLLLEGQEPAFFELVLHQRNEHLFHQIAAVQERWGNQAMVVGVAWGAKHIGAVVHYLSDRWNYVARSGEWVTVFDYTK
jgi:hypothetical protein